MSRKKQNGGTQPAAAVPDSKNRRRGRMIAGIIGAAGVLTGGGLLAANLTETKQNNEAANQPTTISTAGADSVETTAATAPSSASAEQTTKAAPSVSPSHTLSVAEQIAKARADAAKDGYPLKRALVPRADAPTGPVQETQTKSKHGGTLRTVTAKYDLSGQRELLWAADEGTQVGNAHCTQNFHFTNNMAPKIRPTMLLCWHTSAGRSALVVAVAKAGRPDQAETVASLTRAWNSVR